MSPAVLQQPEDRTVRQPDVASVRIPRLGFLGLGWIGRNRLQAVIESGLADVVAIADPSAESVAKSRELAPTASVANGLEQLLEADLDGVVIATPSAQHAQQAVTALNSGRAVFVQKPLART